MFILFGDVTIECIYLCYAALLDNIFEFRLVHGKAYSFLIVS